MSENPALVLEIKELKKNFGHVAALRGVSLEVYGGQVLAIVGDNGAGKSTLIKAVSGVLTPDGGSISMNGVEYGHLNPKFAGECGISTVFQDLALVNSQSVWENIFLGHEYHRLGWLDKRRMRCEAAALVSRLNVDIGDLDAQAGNLSGGQRQAVAVARALRQGGRIIIFDEPTAAMGYRESAAVQSLIKNLAEQGLAVIIISHNIQQAFELADRICVMRQGRVVAVVERTAVVPDDIVAMIIGGVA